MSENFCQITEEELISIFDEIVRKRLEEVFSRLEGITMAREKTVTAEMLKEKFLTPLRTEVILTATFDWLGELGGLLAKNFLTAAELERTLRLLDVFKGLSDRTVETVTERAVKWTAGETGLTVSEIDKELDYC